MASLVRDFRAGRLKLFTPPGKPGRSSAPATDRARGRVVELRRQGLSVHEISSKLADEGTPLNRTSVGQILTEEGFGRLLRGPARFASVNPATAETGQPPPGVPRRRPTLRPRCGPVRRPADATEEERPVRLLPPAHPHPPTPTPHRPRPSHDRIRARHRRAGHLRPGLPRRHALGRRPRPGKALRAHPLPTRPLRAHLLRTGQRHPQPRLRQRRPIQDHPGTPGHRLLRTQQEGRKNVSGADPHMLVMDQKVTTHTILGELDARGVKFLTLRMRSPALMAYINGLTPADYKTITLDRSGNHTKPRVHDTTGVKLTGYPGTVRQLIVTGLGHDTPTVIITNDHTPPTKALLAHYARRMTIEQRLAEIIRAFHLDALSSTVNLNVDLDVVLCVLAQAVTAAFRTHLGGGYTTVTPDVLQRRFLQTPGEITNSDDTTTIRIDRRAYSPVLRHAELPTDVVVPWWGNRRLHYEYA